MLFLEYYLDPKSKTFANCYQSAIKAKFNDKYARTLTAQMPTWLSENINKRKDDKRLEKAENNLDEILEMDVEENVISMVGVVRDPETHKPIKKKNVGLLKIKADVSKFVAETLGNDRYNKKSEIAHTISVEDAMKKNIENRRNIIEGEYESNI